MAKKFYTQARAEQLQALLDRFNDKEVRGNRAAIPKGVIEERATRSWNDYQKTIRGLKQSIKQAQPYELNQRAIAEARGLVYQFNKTIDEQNLRIRKISLKTITNASKDWNSYQTTMRAYRGLLKKGATQQVGTTQYGEPIYKWEQDVIKDRLPKVNREREKIRNMMDFSPYAGTMGTADEWALRELANPLNRGYAKYQIGSMIQSIIHQSTPGYQTRRLDQYKENFLQAILRIPNEDLKNALYQLVGEMDAAQLYSLYSGDAIMGIGYLYPEKETGNDPQALNKRGAVLYSKIRAQQYGGDDIGPFHIEPN